MVNDLIKRSDAIHELISLIPYRRYHNGVYTLLLDKSKCLKTIKSIPAIKRPQGKWIEHEWAEESEGLLISNYECSKCHSWERKTSNYCPNCGAEMMIRKEK